jgi:NAD(P)-dependent dehydrogenase (short-subunit alcohol dehydrogenase family)
MSDNEPVLHGKAVVVTGGARGLGQVMASALAAAGADVVVADVVLDEEQRARPGGICYVQADISDPDGAESAVGTCLERFGRIDVVVNNAGILMREARRRTGITGRVNFWDVDAETVRRFLDVHAVGSFLVAKAAVPHMIAQRNGRVITISTSFSTMLDGGRTPYGPAKAAMEAFAAIMAKDLAGSGVTVNVLLPGHAPGETREQGELAPRSASGKRVVPRVPPEIMGAPAVWLASDASAGVTGCRFIATHWAAASSVAEAVEASRTPIAWATLDHG